MDTLFASFKALESNFPAGSEEKIMLQRALLTSLVSQLAKAEQQLADKEQQLAELKKDKEQQQKDKEQQLAELKKDKEQQLAELKKDKEQQLAGLEQDKKIILDAKDKLLVKQEDSNMELKVRILIVESKLKACDMRPAVEIFAKLAMGQQTPTANVGALSLSLKTGNKLSQEALGWLMTLEPAGVALEIPVAKDLTDLYHELSKPHHFPAYADTGLVIAGELPLRCAVGLAVLKCQQLLLTNPSFHALANEPVHYCNEKGDHKCTLQGGVITVI
jgi:hypothetical protein